MRGLLPLVYDELRKLAASRLANDPAGLTLQPTALVHEALEKFGKQDAEAAALIKLRFFAGLTNEEAGRAMGISERTAKRYWTFARAWLYRELSGKNET
jgi:DNA-directed RNA polymerase specialized sigma24 family protein